MRQEPAPACTWSGWIDGQNSGLCPDRPYISNANYFLDKRRGRDYHLALLTIGKSRRRNTLMPIGTELSQIKAVMLGVRDLPAALAFYQDKLGLKAIMQEPNLALFQCGA